MLKILIAANIALLVADQIWETGVGIIAVLVVTPVVYWIARSRGNLISRIEEVALIAVLALAATDLLDAGLLPVIRI